ncbi:MAG: nuclear transport factor 2 family protein [Pseudomonadales bacterium]|nr:nuclear transport factor 2 family protein [Pseudomonadales bacterium]MCP5183555.1 nuclear transport factor 2 family protein [Pseudomonadales bacterium]
MSVGSKRTWRKKDLRRAVYAEARAIDDRRFDDWLMLFTEDLLYWMPLAFDQKEDDVHTALFFEDRLLMQVRVARLSSPRAFSQHPASHCQHVLQKPRVTRRDPEANVYETATPFVYLESQLDTQIVLGGVVHHQFVDDGGALKIRRKRIELINRDAALPSIQLFP